MDASQEPSKITQSSKQTTERVQALAEISTKIPQMLEHGGRAVNSLTRNPLSHENTEEQDNSGSLAIRRAAFKKNVTAYYTLLNEITESLKEQADALVEAGLLPAVAPKKGMLGDNVTNDGMGNLDVGYLNSRTKDVGLAKEAELMTELCSLLEKYAARQKGDTHEDSMEET